MKNPLNFSRLRTGLACLHQSVNRNLFEKGLIGGLKNCTVLWQFVYTLLPSTSIVLCKVENKITNEGLLVGHSFGDEFNFIDSKIKINSSYHHQLRWFFKQTF